MTIDAASLKFNMFSCMYIIIIILILIQFISLCDHGSTHGSTRNEEVGRRNTTDCLERKCADSENNPLFAWQSV